MVCVCVSSVCHENLNPKFSLGWKFAVFVFSKKEKLPWLFHMCESVCVCIFFSLQRTQNRRSKYGCRALALHTPYAHTLCSDSLNNLLRCVSFSPTGTTGLNTKTLTKRLQNTRYTCAAAAAHTYVFFFFEENLLDVLALRKDSLVHQFSWSDDSTLSLLKFILFFRKKKLLYIYFEK